MSSSSSRLYALRRPAPLFPLICCPDCGKQVKQYRSRTEDHPGWIFYKCRTHGNGCNFWHWEMEYIAYIVEEEILVGEAAVEAIEWAEERREDLELKKEEKKRTTMHGQDLHLMRIREAVREMVLLLQIVVVLLFALSVLSVVYVLKK